MLWLRMIAISWRLLWPHVLAPWRSPLLRWRIETYGVLDAQGRPLHADDLTPADCLRFAVTHRGPLCRFLRWAASL